MIALFVRTELLCSSIRRLPPNRANGIPVFEGSPIRYNNALYVGLIDDNLKRYFLSREENVFKVFELNVRINPSKFPCSNKRPVRIFPRIIYITLHEFLFTYLTEVAL